MLASVLSGVAMTVLGEAPTRVGFVAWAVPVPVVATLLLGCRAGLVWLVITVIAMLAIPVLLPLRLISPIEVPEPMWFQTVRLISLMAVLMAFAILYRNSIERLIAEAQSANRAKSSFLANIRPFSAELAAAIW